MTYEQLVKNMSKGSSYYYHVQKLAYEEMTKFNEYVKYLQLRKKHLREKGKVADRFIIRRPGKKPVYLTIYTKLPKFRTYRQQLAITNKTLLKDLKDNLEDKDKLAILFKQHDDTELLDLELD